MEEALQFSKLGKFFVDAEVVEFRYVCMFVIIYWVAECSSRLQRLYIALLLQLCFVWPTFYPYTSFKPKTYIRLFSFLCFHWSPINFPLREGSVVTSMLIKVDMQAQVDHQSLLNIMQDTLSNGSLGGYQVNSSSVVLKGEFLAHKLVIENVMIIHN